MKTVKYSQTVSLEEITADTDEHKEGSILVHVPEDLDRKLKEYIRVLGVQEIRELCSKDREAHAIMKRSKIDPRSPLSVSEACKIGMGNLARSILFSLDEATIGQMVPADPNNPTNLETHPDGVVTPSIIVDGATLVIGMARQLQQRRGANNRPGDNVLHRGLTIASLLLRHI